MGTDTTTINGTQIELESIDEESKEEPPIDSESSNNTDKQNNYFKHGTEKTTEMEANTKITIIEEEEQVEVLLESGLQDHVEGLYKKAVIKSNKEENSTNYDRMEAVNKNDKDTNTAPSTTTEMEGKETETETKLGSVPKKDKNQQNKGQEDSEADETNGIAGKKKKKNKRKNQQSKADKEKYQHNNSKNDNNDSIRTEDKLLENLNKVTTNNTIDIDTNMSKGKMEIMRRQRMEKARRR